MKTDPQPSGKGRPNDYVVRGPRQTDAMGYVLRGAFVETTLPDDLMMLLQRLDRVTH